MERLSIATAIEARGRYVLGLVATLLLVFALLPVQGARGLDDEDFHVVVPVSTVVHAKAGTTTVVSSTPTPEALVGETCSVSASSENQSSVHPDNDLIVHGSNNDLVIADVEGSPGVIVTATGNVTLPELIVISLVMGPDGVFSAGIDVGFTCGDIGSSTTSSSLGTSTTIRGSSTSTTVGGTSTSTTIGATSTSTSIDNTTTSSQVPSSISTSTTLPTEVTATGVTSTTLETEVLGTEILPFTGPMGTDLALFALFLVGSGVFLVLGARSFAAED